MSTERLSGIEWVRTAPVRMTVDVYSILPRRPILEQEPTVRFKGVADLKPVMSDVEIPLWFKGSVKLYQDGTFQILEFEPLHGVIHGPQIGGNILDIYEHAFSRSLKETNLRILDVVR